MQGTFDIRRTFLRGAIQVRVLIPEIDHNTVASLADVAAPVIQRVFSLCEC